MHKIGIMQGRLSKAPTGACLDWFPFPNWQEEFNIANKLGFNYIELVVNRYESFKNPLFSDESIKKLKKLIIENNLEFVSCCANNIIEENIFSNNVIDNLSNLKKNLNLIGIRILILPLFGKSELKEYKVDSISKKLNRLLSKNNTVQILIESDAPLDIQRKLVEKTKKNIGIVYDIGNSAFDKRNIYREIPNNLDIIKHIHIKDKNKKGINTKLANGIVNLKELKKIIKLIPENIMLTLETTRGNEDIFLEQKNNLDYIKNLYK